MVELMKSMVVDKNTGVGTISIPVTIIRALEWIDRDRIFINIYEDGKIILDKKIGKDMINIFDTKLSFIKNKYMYKISFKKDIMNLCGFDTNNRLISMEYDVKDNNLIIKKI